MSIEEIEAREKAATEGPWITQRDNDCDVAVYAGPTVIAELGDFYPEAEFIAHAREDIPYLRAELKGARATLEAVGRLPSALRNAGNPSPDAKVDRRMWADRLDRILKGGE